MLNSGSWNAIFIIFTFNLTSSHPLVEELTCIGSICSWFSRKAVWNKFCLPQLCSVQRFLSPSRENVVGDDEVSLLSSLSYYAVFDMWLLPVLPLFQSSSFISRFPFVIKIENLESCRYCLITVLNVLASMLPSSTTCQYFLMVHPKNGGFSVLHWSVDIWASFLSVSLSLSLLLEQPSELELLHPFNGVWKVQSRHQMRKQTCNCWLRADWFLLTTKFSNRYVWNVIYGTASWDSLWRDAKPKVSSKGISGWRSKWSCKGLIIQTIDIITSNELRFRTTALFCIGTLMHHRGTFR